MFTADNAPPRIKGSKERYLSGQKHNIYEDQNTIKKTTIFISTKTQSPNFQGSNPLYQATKRHITVKTVKNNEK